MEQTRSVARETPTPAPQKAEPEVAADAGNSAAQEELEQSAAEEESSWFSHAFTEVEADTPAPEEPTRDPLIEELAAKREAAAEEGGEAYEQAVQAEAAALVDHLAKLPPEEQAKFLAEQGGAEEIAALLEVGAMGSDEVLTEIVGSLVAAGETLDDASLAILADVVRGGGGHRIEQALIEQITAGSGARLAAQVAMDPHQQEDGTTVYEMEDEGFALEVLAALDNGSAELRDTAARAAEVRARMAAGAQRLAELHRSPEEIEAWKKQFLEENQQFLDAYEAAAAQYASTLGARTQLDPEGGFLEDAGLLAGTELGGQLAAEALMQAAAGEPTWLDALPEEEREALVRRGAMEGVAAFAAAGDVAGLNEVLKGLEAYGSEEDAATVAAIREKLAEIGPDADPETLRAAIQEAFATDPDAEPTGLMGRLGAAAGLGLAAGATDVAQELAGEGTRVAGVAKGLGSAFGVLAAGMDALGHLTPDELGEYEAYFGAHAGLDLGVMVASMKGAGGATAILSLVDAGFYLAEGNLEAAGLALLPLMGQCIGAFLGAMAGGVFAGIGGILGGLAGGALAAVLSALGFGSPDKIQEILEPMVADWLATGAGWDPEVAEKFADIVASEDFGPKLDAAAEAMGYGSGQELLQALGGQPAATIGVVLRKIEGVGLYDEEDGSRTALVGDSAFFAYAGRTLRGAEED